jgi:hypothetical protein
MKSGVLLIVLGSLYTAVPAQIAYPGGVKNAVIWYSADTTHTTAIKPGLRSCIPADTTFLTFDHATFSTLNFHPALQLDGRHVLSLNLGNTELRSATFFTVYQVTDTANENSIWYTTQNNRTGLVLTTDRMADLPLYRYMNFHDVIRQQPKVNVYVQYKEKDSFVISPQSLNIGGQPVTPRVPVANFNGLIPELIIYDRALNSTERLQIASWLALKYGITLTEPGATYLNSAGDAIWKGYDYPQWHHNIAGIGRDDATGLHQSKATSSNTPGLLTIATNASLIDQSFLLWGDNGKPLIPAPKTPGQPGMLQRTWLMKPYGSQTYTTSLQIDTKSVDAPLPVQPVFWLVIDPSGKGNFNTAGTEFISMDALDKQGIATFTNVTWDKDGSGKDIWGLMAAQDLLLQTIIDQPACTQQSTGRLQTRILGGKAPFQLTLQSTSGVIDSRRLPNNQSPIQYTQLTTGKYFLTVIDANLHRYTDSFYINHTDLPLPALQAGQYTLPAGSTLTLNAGTGLPSELSWEWKGPDNFQSFSPQARITNPGVYTIRCGKGGCYNQQDITVKAIPNNRLYDVTIFPNPSTGRFAARVTLDEPAPVTMLVYAPDGQLITTQKGDHRSNYLFIAELKTAGAYELVLTSGLSKTSKRLVIVK